MKKLSFNFDLPVFEEPKKEWWPRRIPWEAVVEAFSEANAEHMRNVYKPEDRLRGKNPAPFRWE